MSKLWIVHRNPKSRSALARLSGLVGADLVTGSPTDPGFDFAGAPAAVLLGLENDFERELEFAHRHRSRLQHTRWILLCGARDASEARRLFDVSEVEVLVTPPTARDLRVLVADAVATRRAASLAVRRHHDRIAERFSSWLAPVEIPGLLRALDPGLADLPMLARGRAGSGRALLIRYVELFRAAKGRLFRTPARDVATAERLAECLRDAHRLGASGEPIRTVWIDEIDRLPLSTQQALVEWILYDAPPSVGTGFGLRWIATAGPSGLDDRLEPGLERAFAPLILEVPAVADDPAALHGFVDACARDWARQVGGPVRGFSPGALAVLESHPWSGDRAEVEAVVRTSLADSSAEVLQEADLHFPGDAKARSIASSTPTPTPTAGTRAEPVGRGVPVEEPVRPAPAASATAPSDDSAPTAPAVSSGESALPTSPSVGRTAVEPAPDVSSEMAALAEAWTAADEAPFEDPFGDLPQALPESPAAQGDGFEDLEQAFEAARAAGAAEDQGTLEPAVAPRPEVAAEGAAPDGDRRPDEDVDESVRLSAAALGADEVDRAGAAIARGDAGDAWRRLARSLSHEIRNPLVSIRTFAQLLPEHFEDETFRARFSELVNRDVAHISDVLTRLSSVAERARLVFTPVDVSEMIEALLEARKARIAEGRLLVLRELEREAPLALADAGSLEAALAGLIDRALASLPERGDLFVATRYIERSTDGSPRLRVLLRHHNPDLRGSRSGLAELDPAANILEYVLAEAVVEAGGGSLTIDATDAQETLILVDLRTPAEPSGDRG